MKKKYKSTADARRRAHEHYWKNRTTVLEKMRQARRADPEKNRAKCAAYYRKHRKAVRKATLAYYHAHKDKYLLDSYRRRRGNPAKWKEYQHRYQTSPKAQARRKAYRKKNWDRLRIVYRTYSACRRARKRGITPRQRKAVLTFYRYVAETPRLRCHWCKKITGKARRHVDHRVPLARGGKHARSNLVCSCDPCNRRKHARMPAEFRKLLKAWAKESACTGGAKR